MERVLEVRSFTALHIFFNVCSFQRASKMLRCWYGWCRSHSILTVWSKQHVKAGRLTGYTEHSLPPAGRFTGCTEHSLPPAAHFLTGYTEHSLPPAAHFLTGCTEHSLPPAAQFLTLQPWTLQWRKCVDLAAKHEFQNRPKNFSLIRDLPKCTAVHWNSPFFHVTYTHGVKFLSYSQIVSTVWSFSFCCNGLLVKSMSCIVIDETREIACTNCCLHFDCKC